MAARSGMAELVTRLRGIVEDRWILAQDTAVGDGSTKVHWLTRKPEKSGGTVSLGGTVQTLTTDYTWNTIFGRVEFVSAPVSGGTITVEYQYSHFTDDELQTALDRHVTYIRDEPLEWLPISIGGGTAAYQDCKSAWRDLEGTASGTAYWVVRDAPGSIIALANYTPDPLTGMITFPINQGGTAYYLTTRSYDIYAAGADVWGEKAARVSEWYQVESDGHTFSRQQAWDHAVAMEKQCRARAGQNRQRGGARSSPFVRTDLNASPVRR